MLQKIEIVSDSDNVLKGMCNIFFLNNKDLEINYYEEEIDENKNCFISMISYDGYRSKNKQKLPFPIRNGEQLYFFLKNWLESKKYIFPNFDFDGDIKPGWFISNNNCYFEYIFKFGRDFCFYGK